MASKCFNVVVDQHLFNPPYLAEPAVALKIRTRSSSSEVLSLLSEIARDKCHAYMHNKARDLLVLKAKTKRKFITVCFEFI